MAKVLRFKAHAIGKPMWWRADYRSTCRLLPFDHIILVQKGVFVKYLLFENTNRKRMTASRTNGSMLAFSSGQTQYCFTFRAFFVDMRVICLTLSFSITIAFEFAYKLTHFLVFLAARFMVSREKSINCQKQKSIYCKLQKNITEGQVYDCEHKGYTR